MKKRKILGSLVIIALLFISCTNPFFKDFLVSENSTTDTNKTNAEVPKISFHSDSEITVTLNQPFTLTIEASVSDGGNLTYQWYENDDKKTEGSAMIAGKTEPKFTGSIDTASQLFYYCVVKNTNETANGDKIAKKTSNFFSVKAVAEINAESPSISAQPVSDSDVEKDSTKTLSITASVTDGGTLSYQWYSSPSNSNSGGTEISGATDSTYTVPTTEVGPFYYYCVVTNTNNNVNGAKTATTSSAVAIIEVIAAKDAETPTISSHPQNKTVSTGTVVELTILASVSDGGNLSYQWYKNTTNSNSGGTVITDETGTSYTVPTTTEGTFYYYCEVTNTNNNVHGTKTATETSDIAEVIVNDLINAETPRISDQPQTDTNVIEGDTKELTISASVSDGGTLTYQWYSNSTSSTDGATAISSATNSTYTVPTTAAGTTFYYCVVTNTNNNVDGNKTATATSNIAKIEVLAKVNAQTPLISTQPQSDTVIQGNGITLIINASVSDGGTLTYQWYTNSTDSNSDGTLLPSATSATYLVSTNTVGTYHYYCVVTNTNSSATGEKTATKTSTVATIEVKSNKGDGGFDIGF